MEEITVNIGKFQITGISKAGDCSYLVPKGYPVVFDMGVCTKTAASQTTVLLTHGHHDHCAGLYRHYRLNRESSSLKTKSEKLAYLMPPEMVEPMSEVIHGHTKLEAGMNDPTPSVAHSKLIPFKHTTDTFQLTTATYIRAFPTRHCVPFARFNGSDAVEQDRSLDRMPSQGYTIYERRRKLKPEFMELEGKEIGALVKAGTTVYNMVEVPVISYTGDTTIEGVINHPTVLESELLIMECTIIDDARTPEDCHSDTSGHTHLDDILTHVHAFTDVQQILLCHLSKRYAPEYARQTVQERLIGTPLEGKVTVFIYKKKMKNQMR